jgi:D-ribulokinase
MPAPDVVLGIDIGTSGVKVLAVDPGGAIVARGAAALPRPVAAGPHREQDAELWWQASEAAIGEAVSNLPGTAVVAAVSVDATSGTIVPVGPGITPLRPGLMYNDARAGRQAAILNELGAATLSRLGYRFNASFALPKILWLLENEPGLMEKADCILHQSDFVTARLIGAPAGSDESNALKTGFDIVTRTWPGYLADAGIDAARLPRVLPIGATLGHVSARVADALGLPRGCRVVAGMSDGTAGCAASGASAVGDMTSTLGTTLVWKVIAASLVCDPLGRLYCHRHPGGGFLPGGAGNAGGAGIAALCVNDGEDRERVLAALQAGVRADRPSGAITYPLAGVGERFPFVDGDFVAFSTADLHDPSAVYASCLEGLACIERWGYEVAAELGAPCDGTVWTTGKGAEVDVWMQIRANVLNRSVARSACAEPAFGSALVAAMNVWFDGCWQQTATAMVQRVFRYEPAPAARAVWDDHYARFRDLCDQRRNPRQ